MSRITLDDLQRVNKASIQRAGVRYTPSINPDAPNLEIKPLVSALGALGHSIDHKRWLEELEGELRLSWENAPKEIISLFNRKISDSVAGATLVRELRGEKPGTSATTMRRLQNILRSLTLRLRDYEERLYNIPSGGAQSEEDRRRAGEKLHSLQQFQRPINKLREFINSPDFPLIQNNLLFLAGGWGTGKTHFLCDIATNRAARNLPSLLLLGQNLPPRLDPLIAACRVSGLTSSPHELLSELDRLGMQAGGRALLIIDGINEGDRTAWHHNMTSIIRRVRQFDNVALVLSCRTPFDTQILTANTSRSFVRATHFGFEDIEFDAQREFFRHYKIPTPHIPLLAPEFSRPLFLKILCETIASLKKSAKFKRINEFAAGHKSMTRLLEDFVKNAGKQIEADFGLSAKACWYLLKGQVVGERTVGLAIRMAKQSKDFISRDECLSIIREALGLSKTNAETFLLRCLNEGILAEDAIFQGKGWIDVIRLPYQRFSDHLIARHLLDRYLDTQSETAIRRSFGSARPLGKVFRVDRWGHAYEMPGIASAVMLEFPERVKRILPPEKRELFFHLPKASRVGAFIDPFIEGLLWRSSDSFCAQTGQIVSHLLDSDGHGVRQKMLEALVCLGSRTGHPYDAKRLYGYLSRKTLIDRDLFWSEFLRSCDGHSAVYRVLDWIQLAANEPIDEATIANLIRLCALTLTTTVRPLRDRATRCLVILGQLNPRCLFEATAASFDFSDPYVAERMTAASYGVLMHVWAFPSPDLAAPAVTLAADFRQRLRGSRTTPPIEHILVRDYASGFITLTMKLAPAAASGLSLTDLRASRKSRIPSGYRLSDKAVEAADPAIHMDFNNYTTGRLVEGRPNYDSGHKEYRRVRRQIRWRMLNLGYNSEKLLAVDREIGSSNFRMGRSDGGKKVDRYGKKYSWVAFYEVAGRRQLNGVLPHRHDIRISDIDIDPSFPDKPLEWQPPVLPLFESPYLDPPDWASRGPDPDYRQLHIREEVDGIAGPWVLLNGFITERAASDPRKVFTFLRGLIVSPGDVPRLSATLEASEYPGNHQIPDLGDDYYLFAGEIGWSPKYGAELRRKDGVAKPQVDEAFGRTDHIALEKPYGELTPIEKHGFDLSNLKAILADGGSIASEKAPPKPREVVIVNSWVHIPGIKVEIPCRRFSWESYHSEENAASNPDYPAPSVVDYLQLRRKRASVDLVDPSGRLGMIYREFGDEAGFTSSLLYLRADLLNKYLRKRRKALVWIDWGEREFDHKVFDQIQEDPALREAWQTHAHIHKRFEIYTP